MTFKTFLGVVPAVLVVATLSACSGSSTGGGTVVGAPAPAVSVNAVTQSSFVLPTGSGTIYAGLSAVEGGSDIDIEGDGFAYQVGTTSEGNFAAVAGVVTDGTLPAVGTSGTATYSGTYALVHMDRGSVTDVTALVTAYEGDMSLTADLGDGSFSGISAEFTETSDGRKPVFYTKGTISSGEMEGLARFRQTDDINIRADMTGLIGANKAVGAFQGGDDEVDAIAGGFNVLAD